MILFTPHFGLIALLKISPFQVKMVAEVGLAFLSASLQVLFDRLASPKVVNFIKGKKLDQKLLQRLKTTLYAVGAVLNDAENKQIKDFAVKNWLDDLRDAVYEADDLFDELSTKAATQSPNEVSNFFSFASFQDREMGNKIVDIIQRLEDIAKHKDILGLKITVGEKLLQRPQSTSLVEVSDVYGRDKDKEAIINILLSGDMSDSKIGVIPIVGMGGVGKTTLAQLVYNDVNVKQNFEQFAWVCVSEEFDVFRIIKTVIEVVTSRICDTKDLNLLQLHLKEQLQGKKFLIVLDDVWNENYTDWDPLITLFRYGREGSKLIVTTRSERVASIVQTVPFYLLGHLSDEDCWLVFAKHASYFNNPPVDSYLEKYHKDIICKCKGLPLAAKILGGLLRSKHDVKKWDIILKNDIWYSSDTEAKIVPALRISYHYLPPSVKRCFVHCSLFPKDYEFSRNELILLWMAEDLLQPTDRNMALEEVGYEYFDELLSRSFFQRSSKCIPEGFIMHDLIHDLATFFAGEFYSTSVVGEGNNVGTKTRHMSYNMVSGSTELKSSDLEVLTKANTLRTFLPLIPPWNSSVSIENVPHIVQLLSNLKCLRVLSLCKFEQLEILHDSIAELIHLRYLDLSKTKIKSLPGSLFKLHNLQTLKLVNCYNLTGLPSNIEDLVNLRYLDVSETPLQEMPRGIGKLKNLHYLSYFKVGKDQGGRIEELGDLSNLSNKLCIENLQYVSDGKEASLARMMDKHYIESLDYIWTSNDYMLDSTTERDILKNLQPHKNLKSLLIKGYRGTRFPDWLGHLNMIEITLEDGKNCCSLPSFGELPFLKKLVIKGFEGLVSVDAEFYKSNKSSLATPFPSLEYLEFSSMLAWQEWCLFDKGSFPQLRELTLCNCPRLMGNLPKHLPALEILVIDRCFQLASFIPRAALIGKLIIKKGEGVVLQAEGGELLVKNLEIKNCRKLEFPKQLSHVSLKSLEINNSCDSLISFPIDAFSKLERLIIHDCRNLKSFLVSHCPLQNLQYLRIINCPNLISLLEEGLLVPRLTYLAVWRCPNLKSLPSNMNKLLPMLKALAIVGCPEIVLPGEGLQTNLTGLQIDHCVFTKYFMQWHLPTLTHLHIVNKYDDDEQCFPKLDLLTPSLTSLWLDGFPSLEMLDCNGFLQLTSLQHLDIWDCSKLQKIEGERLPPSLICLYVTQCPLFEEGCHMKNAEIWPKISHIPTLWIGESCLTHGLQ